MKTSGTMPPKPIFPLAIAAVAVGLCLASAMPASAQNLTWDANGALPLNDGAGVWLNPNQWYDGSTFVTWSSGANATFGVGGAGGAVTLASPTTVESLTFNPFTGTYTLGTAGQTITLNNGILMNGGSGAVSIISPITLGAAQSWTNNSSSLLTIGTGAVDNGGFLLTVAGTGNTTVSSVISGAGALTKTGTGRLTLSAANSYSGQLSIQNGELFVNAINPNNNNANGVFGNSALSVILGGSGTTGRLSIQRDAAISTNKDFTLATGGTGEIQFGNVGTFQITNADRNLTLSGSIGGGGNLVKLGGAAVVLSGSNNYSGTTTVNEGQLRLSNASALPGGIGVAGGASALTINGNGIINVGATIGLTSTSGDFLRGLGTGADQFQITGGVSGFDAFGSARQVIVNNDAAFELQWGTSTFNPSEFLLGSNTNTATQAITVQNKIDLNGETRTVRVNSTSGSAISTLSGEIRTISGTAGLVKTGVGTLVLSGANTYNGATTISGGTLRISNASTFTNTSAINLALGARLEVSAANANLTTLATGGGVPVGSFLRYSSAQTAAGSANGPGTIFGTVELNLTNVNPDYTLDFGSGSTFQNLVTATYTSPIALSGNASLLSSSAVFTLNSGGITASSAGAKTLTLTGTNTGANTINSVIGNGSGTLAVSKTGTGSWTLAGANTYSGPTTVSAGTLTLSGADGAIGSSAVTIAGGTLTVSNTAAANNGNRLSDSSAFTMNGGTFNFNNTAGAANYSESAGTLTLIGGSNTVAIQQAAVAQTSTLTFAGLSRTVGVLNFSGAGLGTGVDPRSTITFTSAPTLVNDIIGPWATVNGLGYATLSGNDVVLYNTYADVNRGTGGTKAIADGSTTDVRIIESGAAANITLGAATTTVRSILNSVFGGTADTTTIAIGAGETLRTDSINAVATTAAMNIGNVINTGTLTSATAGGDLLLINSSTANNFANANNNMTVNSVIADNTSASTVTKDGAGVLRLTGTNTYSGGTFINAGIVVVQANANLGAAGTGVTFNGAGALSFGNHPATTGATIDLGTRPIEVNNEAIAGLYHNWANVTTTISGNITGDGGLIWGRDPVLTFNGGDGFQRISLLGTANTFTGPLTVGVGNENIGVASYFRFNSLGNSANPITLNSGSIPFEFNSGAIADLSLDRPIVLGSASGTLINSSAFALTYNGSLLTSGTGARTLSLGGTGAGLSTFGGAIADGPGQQVSVTKSGSGTWSLAGVNTYSGLTTITNTGGALRILGKPALSPNSKVVMERTTTLSLRMDDSGTVNLGNEIELSASDTSSGVVTTYTIDVRNNGGATTGSTLVLGKLDFAGNPGNLASSRRILTTGDNGYRLQFGDVDLSTAILGTAAGGPHRFEPQTAPITITGTVQQVSGNTGASSTDNNLYLGGIIAGNLISGTIADAADYPSNPNSTPLNVTKGEVSTWTLSGTNTYTGATNVNAGTLLINGNNSAATGAVSVAAGATLGGNGIIGGAVTFTGASFLSPGNSPGQLTMPSLSLAAATTTTMELGGTTLGTLYDNITINADGTLGYNGFLDIVNFGAFDMDTVVGTTVYDLFSFSGTTVPSGIFSTVTVNGNNLSESGGVWTGSNGGDASYEFTQSTGNLIITVVPEPATLALLGVGVAFLGFRLRKRLGINA
jgi:autotransporter-associated beta strand protein